MSNGIFQALKRLLGYRYPHIGNFGPDTIRDRLVRVMAGEEGTVLLFKIAENADKLADYACEPQIARDPLLSAHANGGAYALRRLGAELEALKK